MLTTSGRRRSHRSPRHLSDSLKVARLMLLPLSARIASLITSSLVNLSRQLSLRKHPLRSRSPPRSKRRKSLLPKRPRRSRSLNRLMRLPQRSLRMRTLRESSVAREVAVAEAAVVVVHALLPPRVKMRMASR